MESHEFEGGTITVIKDNILLVEYEKNTTITPKLVLELKEMREKLIGNNKFYAIADFRNGLNTISEETKIMVSQDENLYKHRHADVFLVDSFAKKIEVELYLRIHKPKIPTKVFSSLNKALTWVEKQEKSKLVFEEA